MAKSPDAKSSGATSPEDRAPAPVGKGSPPGTPAAQSSRAEIDAFLAQVRSIDRANRRRASAAGSSSPSTPP